jgi:hypothetical protein
MSSARYQPDVLRYCEYCVPAYAVPVGSRPPAISELL